MINGYHGITAELGRRWCHCKDVLCLSVSVGKGGKRGSNDGLARHAEKWAYTCGRPPSCSQENQQTCTVWQPVEEWGEQQKSW